MKKEIIGLSERVSIRGKAAKVDLVARIDTGATYNSIDEKLAEKLGLIHLKKQIRIRAASGKEKRRKAHAILEIKGRKIKSVFTITDRSHMRYRVLIGTRTLGGRFLIDPSKK